MPGLCSSHGRARLRWHTVLHGLSGIRPPGLPAAGLHGGARSGAARRWRRCPLVAHLSFTAEAGTTWWPRRPWLAQVAIMVAARAARPSWIGVRGCHDCCAGDVVNAATARLWFLTVSSQSVLLCGGGAVVACANIGFARTCAGVAMVASLARPGGGSPAAPWWWAGDADRPFTTVTMRVKTHPSLG